MKTITVSEFRRNIKKYVEIALKEKVMVSRGDGKSFFIVPIENIEDEGYDSIFVQKIMEAEKDIKRGEFSEIKDVKNLWENIN